MTFLPPRAWDELCATCQHVLTDCGVARQTPGRPQPPRKALTEWQVADVCQWLSSYGLSCYADAMRENCVDGEILYTMNSDLAEGTQTSEQVLSDLSIKRIHAKKFLNHLNKLEKGEPAECGPAVESTPSRTPLTTPAHATPFVTGNSSMGSWRRQQPQQRAPTPAPASTHKPLLMLDVVPGRSYGLRWCRAPHCMATDCVKMNGSAHSRESAYCGLCDKAGHVFADHDGPLCYLCGGNHEVRACQQSSYNVQDKAGRRADIFFGECCNRGIPHDILHCGYGHQGDKLFCVFCKMRGHALDECANGSLRCSHCGHKGHHKKNKKVCAAPQLHRVEMRYNHPCAAVWRSLA